MARTVRNASLETRGARLRLPKGRNYWVTIDKGIALGYRRPTEGNGTWIVRVLVDATRGVYRNTRIGSADDFIDASGDVLDYFAAARKARDATNGDRKPEEPAMAPLTVARATELYLAEFKVRGKSLHATEAVIRAHILPRLGPKLVTDLTTNSLKQWIHKIATSAPLARGAKGRTSVKHRQFDPSDPDALRKRRATANRVLNVFRAILNHAFREELVPSDRAWRRVKPFAGVDLPRVRFIELEEARALVDKSAEPFRPLVEAALLTGARYAEIARFRVGEFDEQSATIFIPKTKSGRPRHVHLSSDGLKFFKKGTEGRQASEFIFLRPDGEPWKPGHQKRPMDDASDAAKISPRVTFHVLRHTYASWLARRGVSMKVIAEALGHADSRITERHYAHLAPSHVASVIRENLPSISDANAGARP